MTEFYDHPPNQALACSERRDAATIRRYTSLPLDVRNPSDIHPVLFNWDNSGSTDGNGGLVEQNRIQTQLSTELKMQRAITPSVVAGSAGFGKSTPFELRTPLTSVDKLHLQPLVASTGTPHCQRLPIAVDFMVQARQVLATTFEREVRTSWIFDFCDGHAQDKQHLAAAIKASQDIAMRENIHIFFFGIGRGCDIAYLQQLAQPGRPAVHVTEVESFRRFFEWLTQSLHMYRCSRPGDRVELPRFGDGPRLITEG